MALLSDDIAAFDRMKADLEAEHFGEWVVFKDGALIQTFASFEDAATLAVDRFDRGPYLIRQVGASAVNLPAAVMFRPAHAPDSGGLKDGNGEAAPDLLVRLGPTLLIDVGFKSRGEGGAPDLELKRLKALVDTGAGDSCIEVGVAARARLPVMDQRVASGIGGATRVNMYLGRMFIPSLGQLLFQSFAGVELESGGQWHQALLGRTFLRPYVLTYHGLTGEVTIADGGV